jgi:hypothetical protein
VRDAERSAPSTILIRQVNRVHLRGAAIDADLETRLSIDAPVSLIHRGINADNPAVSARCGAP